VRSLILGLCELILTLVLLITGARALGNLQPLPEALAQLHLTDCALPCWLGITPGKTTFEEAVGQVSAVYPHTNLYGGSLYAVVQIGSAEGSIEIRTDSESVVRRIIIVVPSMGELTRGDIASVVGTPTCEGDSANIAIYGSSPRTFAYLLPSSLTRRAWYAVINAIEIFNNAPNPCVIPHDDEEQPLIIR
jgi:hypothetical protein